MNHIKLGADTADQLECLLRMIERAAQSSRDLNQLRTNGLAEAAGVFADDLKHALEDKESGHEIDS